MHGNECKSTTKQSIRGRGLEWDRKNQSFCCCSSFWFFRFIFIDVVFLSCFHSFSFVFYSRRPMEKKTQSLNQTNEERKTIKSGYTRVLVMLYHTSSNISNGGDGIHIHTRWIPNNYNGSNWEKLREGVKKTRLQRSIFCAHFSLLLHLGLFRFPASLQWDPKQLFLFVFLIVFVHIFFLQIFWSILCRFKCVCVCVFSCVQPVPFPIGAFFMLSTHIIILYWIC